MSTSDFKIPTLLFFFFSSASQKAARELSISSVLLIHHASYFSDSATLRLLPTTMICRLWINSIKQNKKSFCSHGAYKSVLRHRKLIHNLIIIQCVKQ